MQRTPRTTAGRVFPSNITTPGVSFVEELRGRTRAQRQPQTHLVAVAGPAAMEPRIPAALPQHEEQTTDQSFRALNVKSLPLDKMIKIVVMAVQQVMTESNGVVLEKTKIVVIIKIVLNLMEQNGH
jgi:hypothetical protein